LPLVYVLPICCTHAIIQYHTVHVCFGHAIIVAQEVCTGLKPSFMSNEQLTHSIHSCFTFPLARDKQNEAKRVRVLFKELSEPMYQEPRSSRTSHTFEQTSASMPLSGLVSSSTRAYSSIKSSRRQSLPTNRPPVFRLAVCAILRVKRHKCISTTIANTIPYRCDWIMAHVHSPA